MANTPINDQILVSTSKINVLLCITQISTFLFEKSTSQEKFFGMMNCGKFYFLYKIHEIEYVIYIYVPKGPILKIAPLT